MKNPLPAGTRIRFTKTLTEGANEDHPSLLYANKGDYGEVVEGQYSCNEDCWVKVDWWPNPFGANIDEFEVLENQNEQPN